MILSKEFLKSLAIEGQGYTESPWPLSFNQYEAYIKHSPFNFLKNERQVFRENINNYYPEFQSALVFLFPFKKMVYDGKGPKISSYALGFDGRDYHSVIKEKLEIVTKKLREKFEDIDFKICVDTSPLMEKDLACKSGLGLFGKNSLLINNKLGSYFIIGSILLSQKLPIEESLKFEWDPCRGCNICVKACPTNAIDEEKRTIDHNKCLSAYTIELSRKGVDPPEGMKNSGGWIYGCDICQLVCPYNKKVDIKKDFNHLKDQNIQNLFLGRSFVELLEILSNMSDEEFKKRLKNSNIVRTGRKALIKNIESYIA